MSSLVYTLHPNYYKADFEIHAYSSLIMNQWYSKYHGIVNTFHHQYKADCEIHAYSSLIMNERCSKHTPP
jgi:hypothetical protein